VGSRNIIVIGASAGGIAALLHIARNLPRDLDAAILIVVHTGADSPGILHQLLSRAGPVPASLAIDGSPIRPGRIYVAPPDYHLLVKDQRLRVVRGPKENGFRPAVDPLFRTAARNFGERVVGIVLSGGLDDGTDGLRIIKEQGGVAIAQNPEEAEFPSMPGSAIRNVAVDHIVRLDEIPALIERYASNSDGKEPCMRAGEGDLPEVVEHRDDGLANHGELGEPSALTCPECGGALWQERVGNQLKFRCHVGHMYTGDGLISASSRILEQSLWTAVRTMEEAAEIRRRMARLAESSRWKGLSPPYEMQASELEQRAAVIRNLLESGVRHFEIAHLQRVSPMNGGRKKRSGVRKRKKS
jgi:two-component system chemotaxis response regulator CheB